MAEEIHPIDIAIGARIVERRKTQGVTQAQLASAVGVTFQQIQKYENAKNRVAASRLYDIAVTLKIGIEYFYQDAPDPGMEPEVSPTRKSPERLKVEALYAGDVGTGIRFRKDGDLTRKDIDAVCRRVAPGAWFSITETDLSYAVKKVRR